MSRINSIVKSIYVYTRVSSIKQSTDIKCGLKCQKEVCTKYIDNVVKKGNSNITITYWTDVGSSYKNKNRLNELIRMIDKLETNSLIIVSEISRLGRDKQTVKKYLNLIKMRSSYIYSVTENMYFNKNRLLNIDFLNKVQDAEKESDVLSLRIKTANDYIKNHGGYVGRPGFGYKIVKKSNYGHVVPMLTENDEEINVVNKIICSFKQTKSVFKTVTKINDEGLLNKNKNWNYSSLKRILNNFYPEHNINNFSNNAEYVNDADDEGEGDGEEREHTYIYNKKNNYKDYNIVVEKMSNIFVNNPVKLRSGFIYNK